MQSVRQVLIRIRHGRIPSPAATYGIEGRQQIKGKLPVYASLQNILTNPIYAGA
jgi:hypothetical protein